ncbi:MAG: thioredoxin-disulfide reductase [Candidatus Margulisbacteria bacterium]|nr:thioredoxin-disulfide reductase [Candidatus Margulisiibacteriota bacterium]MBU1022157.1 thioredoxin-disulfide reductase [Candidatus Margulisiibacteriota bacterium]MBU1729404.1 thioredoxin-disulfide reductase [Candidatus Margulisiibacteriota bacterium]MBU1955677.1 thioredoxin-disulfide reductase [Candidatus Margulisiibacteriota bacterium]
MPTKEKIKTFPELEAIIVSKSSQIDLLVVGGGPAGLTAGIYGARAGLKVLIVEKALLGGQVSSTFMIENYPGFPNGIAGQELTQQMEAQARRLGVETSWGNVSQIKPGKNSFTTYVDDKQIKSKAVIIASGADSKKLGVAGEDHFRGRGVSYCAVCDGPFYKDKNIMVVGGGNAAIEEALYLTRFAAKVQVLHRRNKLRADKMLELRARANSKIFFVWNAIIKEITGEEKVTEVLVEDTQTKKNRKVKCDGIFVYIGSSPNTEFIKDTIKLNKAGYIKTDAKLQTSVPGIFAAGDVLDKRLRQIVTAAADGALAAQSAKDFIEGSV